MLSHGPRQNWARRKFVADAHEIVSMAVCWEWNQGLHSMPAPVSASAPAAHSAPGAGSSTAELFEQFQTDFLVEMTSPDRPSCQASTAAYASQSQGNPTCGEHSIHWPRSSFRRRGPGEPVTQVVGAFSPQ